MDDELLLSLIGLGLAVLGLGVSIGGLVAALRQLDRTSTAVEAANEAARRAERESAVRQILLSTPVLEHTEQALDAAVGNGEHALARRELIAWRSRGSDVSGLLSNRDDVPAALTQHLTRSLALAATAKERLIDENEDLVEVTTKVRKEIAETCRHLLEMSGRMKAYAAEGVKTSA
jgi:hypothetical protein